MAVGLVIVLVVIIGVYFLMQKQGAVTEKPGSIATKQQAAATTPNTISIKDFAFSPETLTIKVGEKVTWVNEDTATHTIKSDTFNSEGIDQGGKFEFTFNNKGTFNYSCGIHPSMQGKIVVE